MAAVRSMGRVHAHPSTIAPRHTRAGVLWLRCQYTAIVHGVRRIQHQYQSTNAASTSTAFDHAAMAVDAKQESACHFNKLLSAVGAINASDGDTVK